MLKFSICIETVLNKFDFYDRPKIISEIGLDNIEFWDWRDKDKDLFLDALTNSNLRAEIFSGNRETSLITKNADKILTNELSESLQYAKSIGCNKLMLLTDALNPDGSVKLVDEGLSSIEKMQNLEKSLHAIEELSKNEKIFYLIEPLNTIKDHPGYYLNDPDILFDILMNNNFSNIYMLYDVYHMAKMKRNILKDINSYFEVIKHIHIADLPDRTEPGSGNFDFKGLFLELIKLGYDYFVGLEYFPTIDTTENIRKTAEYLNELLILK